MALLSNQNNSRRLEIQDYSQVQVAVAATFSLLTMLICDRMDVCYEVEELAIELMEDSYGHAFKRHMDIFNLLREENGVSRMHINYEAFSDDPYYLPFDGYFQQLSGVISGLRAFILAGPRAFLSAGVVKDIGDLFEYISLEEVLEDPAVKPHYLATKEFFTRSAQLGDAILIG